MSYLNSTLSKKTIVALEYLLITVTALIPVFLDLPYRVNIFLSWEGAYRLYLGQIPFKDFGLPMGFAYWLAPALFFKIFGPFLHTLIITQAVLNMVCLFSFRSILKIFKFDSPQRLVTLFVFVFSFTLLNFWPWYNNTVFIYSLLGLNLLLLMIFKKEGNKVWLTVGGSFFLFLAFFTKQDFGALAIITGFLIMLFDAYHRRSYKYIIYQAVTYVLLLAIFVAPLIKHDFLYWFNYGQFPHTSRIDLKIYLLKNLGYSYWNKFYLLAIVVILFNKYASFRGFFNDKMTFIFSLLTLAMLFSESIMKVTSPLPEENHYFIHGIAIAFIMKNINFRFSFSKPVALASITLLIFLWWSGHYWDYLNRFINYSEPVGGELKSQSLSQWTLYDAKSFQNIYMPENTIAGIERLKELPVFQKEDPSVLNMTELTPLAYELGFTPLKNQPLWYHMNVGMFEKEAEEFCNKITHKEYDVVLFQVIPELKGFYPDQVRRCLQETYDYKFRFEAPRKRTEGYSFVEVYLKPSNIAVND